MATGTVGLLVAGLFGEEGLFGELGIEAVLGEEIGVGALFDDAALVEDVDAVGIADGGEAVGDDDGAAVLHEGVEGFLNEAFCFRIDGSGGFVEEEDGGIFEEGAGDGEALFFSAGEFHAAFADVRVEAFGEVADEIGGAGGFEGGPEFFIGGVAFGEDEIFADAVIEEEGFLGDVAEGAAEGGFGDRVEFVAVDADGAFFVFVEAAEEIDDRGLAGAGGSDEGDGFSGGGLDVDFVEGGLVAVGEGDLAEFHVPGDGIGEGIAIGGVWFVVGIEDLEDAISGGSGGEGHLVELVEAGDGFVEEAEEEEELHELAEFHAAAHDLPAAEAEDEDVSAHADEGHAGGVAGPPEHDAEGGFAEFVGVAVEAGVFLDFGGEALDLADAGDVVVEEGIHVAGGLSLIPVAAPGMSRINPGAGGEEGDGEGGPEGDAGVIEVEGDSDDEDLEDGHEALFDAVDEDSLHGGDVLDDPGHDVSGAAAIEPAEGEALEFPVEIGAEVIDDFLLKNIIEHDSEAIEAVSEEKTGQSGPYEDQKEGSIAIWDDLIDDMAGNFWENNDSDGAEEGTGQLGSSEHGVAPEVGNDA